MRAELKGIMSPDVPDLETWRPETKSFSLMLELEIGPKNTDEGEVFYLEVISSAALAKRLETEPMLFGRAMLIMDRFSYPQVKKFIEKWCSRGHGKNWETVAEQLSRFAEWEMLDYQLFSQSNVE